MNRVYCFRCNKFLFLYLFLCHLNVTHHVIIIMYCNVNERCLQLGPGRKIISNLRKYFNPSRCWSASENGLSSQHTPTVKRDSKGGLRFVSRTNGKRSKIPGVGLNNKIYGKMVFDYVSFTLTSFSCVFEVFFDNFGKLDF